MILALFLAAALPGTQPLTRSGDLALQMVDGIDQYLARRIATDRPTAPPDRARFRHIIGTCRQTPLPRRTRPARKLAETTKYRIHHVRWSVFENVDADGLLLLPKVAPTCNAVAIPDADELPNSSSPKLPASPNRAAAC